MREQFAKLFKHMRKHMPGADLEIVRKAYRVANDAHLGMERDSGEPYISHPLEVARILANLNLDPVTVAAGLLHDVLEDTRVSHDDLLKEFGEEITALVDGVSKIKSMKWTETPQTQKEKQAENLRKMLVATAKDVRVILIKLADRLHNMRTIAFLRDKKRVERICRETLDIYAPLAHRLGIAAWKWELEDHAFHHLNPTEYKHIAAHVAMKRHEREAWLKETIAYLEARLAEAEISARVIGRPKHLYSIYRKMLQQNKHFDEVMDVLAIRIITQTVSGCYNALGVVHQWLPVPGRFKDYIAMPKANMYQSIHTVVMRENGMPLEIQIRTEDMDRIAREGIAAHWVYKEGKTDPKFDGQLRWLRQMYEWLQDAHGPDEVLDTIRRDVGRPDIYVFTPKGEVKELAEGATPLDFAYHVHSDIGHHCIGARVNGKLVPLRYNLQTGDVVEILTSRSQTPHLDWLDVVVTGKARTRIRQRLREIGELEPLEAQLRRDVVRVLPEARPRTIKNVDDATREKMIRVDGNKGIQVQFAKCCVPMPGHMVIGYATKIPGITIHRADCPNFAKTKRDPARMFPASWDGEEHIEIGMRVTTGQRPNMLADITNAIRPMNISITRAQFNPGENGKSLFEFVFEAPDRDSVARVAATLKQVPGVTEVQSVPMSAFSLMKVS